MRPHGCQCSVFLLLRYHHHHHFPLVHTSYRQRIILSTEAHSFFCHRRYITLEWVIFLAGISFIAKWPYPHTVRSCTRSFFYCCCDCWCLPRIFAKFTTCDGIIFASPNAIIDIIFPLTEQDCVYIYVRTFFRRSIRRFSLLSVRWCFLYLEVRTSCIRHISWIWADTHTPIHTLCMKV